MRQNDSSVRRIALVGVFAAAVFATAWMRIPSDSFPVHLGNIMCVLSGLILGPWAGGAASGIGSFLFDLTNPMYIASAPFTLVFKFFIGFFAGLVSHAGGRDGLSTRFNILGGVLGSLVYFILYMGKKWFYDYRFLQGLTPDAALVKIIPNATSSLINAAVAVIVAVPLAIVLRRALARSGLMPMDKS
ncbi:MAG TPA: ECF transporter S component [Oscillospiraceae bacterium]|nr:ECF transporter S component [Oscillospiraceae bacterium]